MEYIKSLSSLFCLLRVYNYPNFYLRSYRILSNSVPELCSSVNKRSNGAKLCIKKIKRNCIREKPVKFKLLYDTTKLEFFTNTKDRTPLLNNSYVVYEFKCPGCGSNYIGKIERTLYERTVEHAWLDPNSVIRQHILSCDAVHHINAICNIDDSLFHGNCSESNIDDRQFSISIVQRNTTVIDRNKNWNVLLIKEALNIRQKHPLLNSGLKASKELELF